jgi:hypothetical protein
VEFVTGTDGAVPDGGGLIVSGLETVGPDRFATLAFPLASASFADVRVEVQGSGDLVSWTALATLAPEPGASWSGPGTVSAGPGPGLWVTVRDVVAVTPDTPRFLRLVVRPILEDADGDGAPDAWESAYGLEPNVPDADSDRDEDGVANGDEFLLGLRPDRGDSDGDGRLDGFEVAVGSDPAEPDGDAWAGNVRHPGTGLLVHVPGKWP